MASPDGGPAVETGDPSFRDAVVAISACCAELAGFDTAPRFKMTSGSRLTSHVNGDG